MFLYTYIHSHIIQNWISLNKSNKSICTSVCMTSHTHTMHTHTYTKPCLQNKSCTNSSERLIIIISSRQSLWRFFPHFALKTHTSVQNHLSHKYLLVSYRYAMWFCYTFQQQPRMWPYFSLAIPCVQLLLTIFLSASHLLTCRSDVLTIFNWKTRHPVQISCHATYKSRVQLSCFIHTLFKTPVDVLS